MRFSRRSALVLLLVLVAFALRAYRLDLFSLRGDESFTVLFVQKPLAQMWAETLTVEPNPPLLYFLLRGWIALAGESEFVTRFFSLFFGVLCVPLAYRLARVVLNAPASRAAPTRLAGKGAWGMGSWTIALTAALLVAINPYQIWHSQDVRNYTLWQAVSLAALVLFWLWYRTPDVLRSTLVSRRPSSVVRPLSLSIVHSSAPLWSLASFVVFELAALYTHYYEAFILLALNLFVFATTWRQWRKLAGWIAAQLGLAILYLPYPLILSNRVSAYGEGSARQGVALWDIARETFSAFVLGETLDGAWRAWLWIPFALIALFGLIYLVAGDRRRGLFFALYAGVPTVGVFVLNTVRPLYLERYLNGIAPAYYILLACGIVALAAAIARIAIRKSKVEIQPSTFNLQPSTCTNLQSLISTLLVAFLVALAAVALANYWTNPAYAKAPDWRGLAGIINAHAQLGDLIVQNFPETSLLYYDRSRLPVVVYPETYLPDARTTQQLNAASANYQRVWFVPAAPDYWDPEQFVEKWLDHRADLLNEWRVGDFRLLLYGTASRYMNAMHKVGADFGGALSLLGYRTDDADGQPRIVLYWRARRAPQGDYRIFLRIENAGSRTAVDVADAVPVRGAYPTQLWRKNEIVVDQHDMPTSVDQATAVQIRVCSPGARNCLPVTGAVNVLSENTLVLPFQP